jgi:GNAT superfamily N-acetyltransferase
MVDWETEFHAIKIMYGYGDSLPMAIHSSCMSRMEAKVKPWMDVEEWHYQYGPKRPHWYLHLVGVNPKYNGQGKGKVIMNKICELADELDQDIYLEAGGKLKGYYEKFGFVVKKV